MTREEAIQFLDNMKHEEAGRAIGKDGFYAELMGYHIEALNIAIKTLEQTEPEKCGDCVSRRSIIGKCEDTAKATSESGEINTGFIMALDFIADYAKHLPSVEPERKTGKWIWEDGNIPYCSNCKKYSDDADMQDIHGEVFYCSHCGAKMMEVEGIESDY